MDWDHLAIGLIVAMWVAFPVVLWMFLAGIF